MIQTPVTQITKLSYICKTCETETIIKLTPNTTMPNRCCRCGTPFSFDDYNDPLIKLSTALESFKGIKELDISLVCEVKDE